MIDDVSYFFVVWNPLGSNPQFRHESEAAAQQEAERLARVSPGNRFYVLKAKGYAEVVKPSIYFALEAPPF